MARKKRRQPEHDTTSPADVWAQRLRPACLCFAMALAVATPLVPTELAEQTGVALPLIVGWLVLATLWFVGAVMLRVPIAHFGWLDGLVLALAGWYAVSGLMTMWQGAPRLTVNAVWTWIGYAATLIMLRQLLRTERETRSLVAVMLALATCVSVAGICQTFIIYPQDRAFYEAHPEEAMRMAGVNAAEGTAQRKQFEDRLYSNEPTATFSLTNSLAGFIAPWLIVLLGIAVNVRRPSQAVQKEGGKSPLSVSADSNLNTMIALLAGVALIGLCLVLTKSRTAWLATVIGVLLVSVIATLRVASRRMILPAMGGCLALAAMLGLLIAAGLLDIEIVSQAFQSLRYRFEYWQSTAAMIAEHPLFGCGPGNFQQYYTTYKLPQASETISDPHNFMFEVAANAGLPALGIVLALLACAALTGPGFSLSASTGNQKGEKKTPVPFFAAAAGVVLAFVIGGMTGYAPQLSSLFFGALAGGLILALLRGWMQNGALPRWLLLIAIAVLLVNLLAAGGIGFPGVAMTLWVLIAVSSSSRERTHAVYSNRTPAAAGAVVAVLLLLACYFSAYRPTLLRSGLAASARQAQAAGRMDEALADLQAAQSADPLSAGPPMQQAMLHFHRWFSQSEPQTNDAEFRQFERMAETALRLDLHAYQARQAIGYLYLKAQQRTGDSACLKKGLALLQQAVELYPQDAMAHAILAWVAKEMDPSGSAGIDTAVHVARALEIDDVTPHEERKLKNRRLLVEISTAFAGDPLVDKAQEKSARQWMEEIR